MPVQAGITSGYYNSLRALAAIAPPQPDVLGLTHAHQRGSVVVGAVLVNSDDRGGELHHEGEVREFDLVDLVEGGLAHRWDCRGLFGLVGGIHRRVAILAQEIGRASW